MKTRNDTATSSQRDTRANITRVGKTINAFCIVAKVFCIILLALALTGIAALYIEPRYVDLLVRYASEPSFVQLVDGLIGEAELPAHEFAAINLFVFALSQASLLIFISILRGLTHDVTAAISHSACRRPSSCGATSSGSCCCCSGTRWPTSS